MRPAGLPSSSKGQEAGARGQGPAGTSRTHPRGGLPLRPRAHVQAEVSPGLQAVPLVSRVPLRSWRVSLSTVLAPRAGPRAGATWGQCEAAGWAVLACLLLGHCFLNSSWTPAVGTLVLSFAFLPCSLSRSLARSILLPTARGPGCGHPVSTLSSC